MREETKKFKKFLTLLVSVAMVAGCVAGCGSKFLPRKTSSNVKVEDLMTKSKQVMSDSERYTMNNKILADVTAGESGNETNLKTNLDMNIVFENSNEMAEIDLAGDVSADSDAVQNLGMTIYNDMIEGVLYINVDGTQFFKGAERIELNDIDLISSLVTRANEDGFAKVSDKTVTINDAECYDVNVKFDSKDYSGTKQFEEVFDESTDGAFEADIYINKESSVIEGIKTRGSGNFSLNYKGSDISLKLDQLEIDTTYDHNNQNPIIIPDEVLNGAQ